MTLQLYGSYVIGKENQTRNKTYRGNIKMTRKQEYVGTIRKCPGCGSEIPSLTAICPSCGHELSNVTESEAMKKFQEGLTNLDGKAQADFIASFSIPNTREDLGNFLITIQSILKADLESDADKQRIASLTSKFNEIKSKILTILPENDPLQQEASNCLNVLNSAMDAFGKLDDSRKRA